MAHYAFLNANNVVVRVIAGPDESTGDWEAYFSAKAGMPCKRTSYNTRAGKHSGGGTPFRKNYAGPGYTYDAQRDAFIPPQTFPSWTLDEQSCTWQPPSPRPAAPPETFWDESKKAWVEGTPKAPA